MYYINDFSYNFPTEKQMFDRCDNVHKGWTYAFWAILIHPKDVQNTFCLFYRIQFISWLKYVVCYSETACQEMLQVTVANLLTFENQVYVSPEKEWLF